MAYLKYIPCIIFLSLLPAGSPAHADDYSIDSPEVDAGEVSLEANLNYSMDSHRNLDRYFSQVYGLQYGVNAVWSTEISGLFEKTADTSGRLTNLKWKNIIAPFKPGVYWLDAGLSLQIEKSVDGGNPDNAEAKLLFEKDINSFMNTANLSLSQDFGHGATQGMEAGYSWRTKYHFSDALEPGMEYYSNLGKLLDLDVTQRQDNVMGPVLQGKFGDIAYDTGVLFGVSSAAHDATFKFNLEYSF